jgi:hypothetical protein
MTAAAARRAREPRHAQAATTAVVSAIQLYNAANPWLEIAWFKRLVSTLENLHVISWFFKSLLFKIFYLYRLRRGRRRARRGRPRG